MADLPRRRPPLEPGRHSLHRETGGLDAWSGFGVFCLYAATALTIGFLLITRRDA